MKAAARATRSTAKAPGCLAERIALAEPEAAYRPDAENDGAPAPIGFAERPIADDEYPGEVASLANGSFGLGGGFDPFPDRLREWLSQALSLEPTRWFASAVEARHAFEIGLKAGDQDASRAKCSLRTCARRLTRSRTRNSNDGIGAKASRRTRTSHGPSLASRRCRVPSPSLKIACRGS